MAELMIELDQKIIAKAKEVGFEHVGFTGATLPDDVGAGLHGFLASGFHGSMGWLETRVTQRASPDQLWPDAKSVIMLAMNYGPEHDPLPELLRKDRGVISVYARNKDYHDLVKKRLKQVGRWLVNETGCEIKVFVDTAPVMEKPLAAAAGLGWQGKHTNLVSRELGSWIFLGAIYTSLELTPDIAESDHCGSCQSCLDICPTSAFPGPYQIDARRCISYLTIEHKDQIPLEFRSAMGNRIYGCDDCLAICPWNKFAKMSEQAAFVPREDLTLPLLSELAQLDDTAFRIKFSGSPIKRIGRDHFVRNVLIAIGNSGEAVLAPCVEKLLEDEASVVRGAAIWALSQIAPEKFAARKAEFLPAESNPEIIAEWMRDL